jgi:predicted metal-dependent enzyme (double-stranded beta helix superfamily)
MVDPVPLPLKRFIWDIQSMVELAGGEREILLIGRDLMTRLVAADDWLPQAFAIPGTDRCRHYRLYGDAEERFSVIATVHGGGQVLPIRCNGVWEIFGILRGAVMRRRFSWAPGQAPRLSGVAGHLGSGACGVVSARSAEVFQMENALADSASISIHVYGGGLERAAGQAVGADGAPYAFMKGYDNPEDVPGYDIWSIQTRIED